jgi:hypothetical protein
MIGKNTKYALPICSSLIGKSVVMLVVLRQYPVPLPCSVIAESADEVRIRIKPDWEIDVRKELILAVEEYTVARDNWIN